MDEKTLKLNINRRRLVAVNWLLIFHMITFNALFPNFLLLLFNSILCSLGIINYFMLPEKSDKEILYELTGISTQFIMDRMADKYRFQRIRESGTVLDQITTKDLDELIKSLKEYKKLCNNKNCIL